MGLGGDTFLSNLISITRAMEICKQFMISLNNESGHVT
jgi:hypothetical protein